MSKAISELVNRQEPAFGRSSQLVRKQWGCRQEGSRNVYWFHSIRLQIESDNKARIEYIIRYKDHDRLIGKPHTNRRLAKTVSQGVEVFYPFSASGSSR
jgi:hypothetical protein